MSRNTSLCHHLFWLFVCLIGNAFQLYWISSQYFRYDISTNVQLLTPDRVDPPVVTMCFDLIRVIKWSAMSDEERMSMLKVDGNYIVPQLEEQEGNITIKNIEMAVFSSNLLEMTNLMIRIQSKFNSSELFRVTLKGSDMFRLVWLYNPVKKNLDIVSMDNNLLEIECFMRANQKCYLFDVKKPSWASNLSYSGIRKQSLNTKNNLASYWFHEEVVWNLNEAIYILSARGHSSRLDINAFLKLPMKAKVGYTLTYNEYRSSLLPPPYATMCRNYSKEGLVSKGGCYETCLRRLSLKRMGILHPALAIFPNETRKTAHVMTLYADKFANKVDVSQEVDNICTEECGQRDCSTVLYAPRYLVSQRITDRPRISQYITLTPIVEADCLEQISLIQFITDISSSFGFWLGMSAIGTARLFVYSLGGCQDTNRTCFGWKNQARRKKYASIDDHRKLKHRVSEVERWLKTLIDRSKRGNQGEAR